MATGKDSKGRFVKGHPFFKSPNGVKNGAKKTIAGEVRDALKVAEDAMPEIYLAMIKRALDPHDKDAQRASEYLSDRIYGKPNQPISSDTPAIMTFVFIQPDGTRITAREALEQRREAIESAGNRN